mmetsp:Transcript_20002/g.49689  ORF Transcript_20002/g.49689 Transcript_20002/m.49689 type:complete len:530 (-) Transcript_20002:802-2391(-)
MLSPSPAPAPPPPREALPLAPGPPVLVALATAPALSRMGSVSVTARASSSRSTSPLRAVGDRSEAAARTNDASRAAMASLHPSPSGRSQPRRYVLSASIPPHSISSNVDAPSPSSNAARKRTAAAAAAIGLLPAVRSGAHAFCSLSTAPSPPAAALKCTVRTAKARSIAARRCGVSVALRPDPGPDPPEPASAIRATMDAALPLPTPDGTTWSRGVRLPPPLPPAAAAPRSLPPALAPAAAAAPSARCAQSRSMACTVPSFLKARLKVPGSLCMSRSTRKSATFTTAPSREDKSPARKDAVCPGCSAAAPSDSICGGAWCSSLASAPRHCSFTVSPTDAATTAISGAVRAAPYPRRSSGSASRMRSRAKPAAVAAPASAAAAVAVAAAAVDDAVAAAVEAGSPAPGAAARRRELFPAAPLPCAPAPTPMVAAPGVGAAASTPRASRGHSCVPTPVLGRMGGRSWLARVATSSSWSAETTGDAGDAAEVDSTLHPASTDLSVLGRLFRSSCSATSADPLQQVPMRRIRPW